MHPTTLLPPGLRPLFVILFSFVLLSTRIASGQRSLDEGITEIAQQLGAKVHEKSTRTIAVVDFVERDGRVSALGQHLGEALITEFFQLKAAKFEVVERRRLNTVLQEQKLTAGALFDQESSLTKIGQLLKVEEVVTGTISDIGDQVEVHARLVSVATGKITSSHRVRIRRMGEVDYLQAKDKATSATPSGSEDGAAPPSDSKSHFVEGIDFTLVEAKRKGTTIELHMFLTSTVRDTDVLMTTYRSAIRIITNNGNEYRAVEGKLGTSHERSNVIVCTLVTKTKTKCVLVFEGVESDAKSIVRFDVNGSFRNTGAHEWNTPWAFVLNDIPIK